MTREESNMTVPKASPKNSGTKAAAKKAAPKRAAARSESPTKADAAVEAYFAAQTAEQRALLDQLRALVAKGVPDTDVSIKWGVPFFQRGGKNICALAAFKEHVAINFFAPPEVLVDPDGKLEGEGKANRMLQVRAASEIDAASIRRWLKAAVAANG